MRLPQWHLLVKVAIPIAMSLSEQMPLADVKNRLSEVVDRLEREHGRVIITKHGHRAEIVISIEDLESREETLDIVDSAALLADIRESLAELSTGQATVLGKDDALLFACVDDDGVIRKEKRGNGRACGGATRYPLQRLLARDRPTIR